MDEKKGILYYSGYSGLAHADIATFLQRTFTTQEQTIATALISSIEVFLAKKCNRNFLYQSSGSTPTDTVYYDIVNAGQVSVDVKNGPIKEVTKIELDGVTKYDKTTPTTNTWALDVDFVVFEDHIEFETIPSSSKNDKRAVKIHYSIEAFWGDDVKHAIKQWVSEIIGASTHGGKTITSVNYSGYSLNFTDSEIPEYVKQVISSYVNLSIC